MARSPRIAPNIHALWSARRKWRGPTATVALFAIMAGGFALVRASSGERFSQFQWPESLSRIFGSRSAPNALVPSPLFAGISLTSFGTAYTQNFDSLAQSGTSNTWTDDTTILGWYSSQIVYIGDTGTSATGGLHSYGSASSSDRALGLLGTGSLAPMFGARFVNNTGTSVNSFNVSFTGEQWRQNSTSQTLTFEYQVGATSLSTGTWTAVSALNFVSPITGAAGALDGNNGANSAAKAATVLTSVANGQEIWFRWSVPLATNQPGLGIDTFSITPVSTISGTLNAGASSSGKTITLLKNGVSVGSNVTSGAGFYSITGVSYNSGDILTVFVDNAPSVRGATVTRGSSGDITGLNIDQNVLTVRHEDAGPITNANLGTGNSGDADLTAVYTVIGSDLTTPAGMSQQIWTGSTYAPGGNINDGGNWINNGTFTHGGFRVTFDGSGLQTITTGGAGATKAFGLVTINKSGGSTATLAGDFKDTTLTITAGVFDQGASFSLLSGAISVAAGAAWKDIGTGDITLSGGVTNSGTININGGTTVCGETQEIVIGSSGGQQPWSGITGNFTIKDVHVSNQGGAALIHVENGADDSGNGLNWIFTPATCTGGTLYVWNPPAPGTDSSYTTAINWTPTRGSQSVDDVLVVDNASTPTTTITDVPTETIGRFRVINGAFATLTSAAATTLTIKGEGSSVPDLDVAGSSRLILSGSNTLTVLLPSGANGNIDNLLTIAGTGNRLIATDANAVTFPAATACTVETGYTGNPFGTAASGAGAGSIVFLNSSTYTHKAGSSPFGAATDASIVTFSTGSTARWLTNSGFQANGRTYADLQIGDATTEAVVADPCATPVNTCTGNFVFQNLAIWNNVGSTYPKLTFVGSGASTVTIRGNIISAGGTGNFQDISLSGGTGGIVIDKPGSTVTFSDNSGGFRGIQFESNARLTSTTTLALARKILMGQSPPPTFVLSVPIDATLNGGPDAYVIGKLLKNFDGSNTTQTFQVGDVNKYSPIVVSNSSGTGTLTINARTPKHPNISGINALARYWQIDNTGLTSADLAFHYPGVDVPGTATESSFKFFRYSGGTFTPFNVSSLNTTDANDHIATLTGVTQFSDWTLAEPASVGETNVSLTSGNLVITDGNGGASNDNVTISLVAGPNIRVNDPTNALSCGAGMTQVNANTCDIPQGSITGNIQVDTLGGNDALTINYSGGNPLPAGGLVYAGGLGATDVLTITGGSAASIAHTFANANDGSVNIDGTVISYTGLEPVTDNMAAVDRVFTFTGGSETITLNDATGANMTIDSTLSESVTFANPTGSLTINAGTGDDTVTVASVDTDGPYNVDLTINGDDGGDVVNLNADITFAAGENLDVNLTNDAGSGDVDAINVGANANLVFSGGGAATLAGSYYIAMASGSSIATVNGAITLNANTAGLTSGNFVGIDVNAATVQSTGTGSVTLTGKGGSAASSQYGVRVMGGGDIIGGTTGTATITGTGRGTGAGSANSGVFVTGTGSSISSNGASVQVTGQGGLGSLSSGIDMSSGGLITAGGFGNVTLNATGGGVSGTGAFNHGIIMAGATVNSSGGDVSVTGTGGAGNGAAADFTGCHLDDSTITSGLSGTVTLNCTAGTAPTSQTLLGVDVRFTSQITSSGGNVFVTGTGGNTTNTSISAGAGVRLIGNGTITAGGTGTVTVTGSGVGGSTTGHEGVVVSGSGLNTNQARIGGAGATAVTATSGNGASHALALGINNAGRITTSSDSPITIIADSVNFGAGAIVSSGTGPTTIRQRTAGTLINLGGADVLSGSPLTLGLTDVEVDSVTAGTLNLGNANSGSISFSGASPIDVTDGPMMGTVNLVTGGAINSNSTAGVLDIVAAALNLTSVTGIDIEMNADTLTTSSANLQNLSEANTVAVGAADINASGFTLTLSGGRFNTVSGGDILANSVQVQSGATVGGTGTVTTGGGGINVQSGGTVSPGTSPGILNTGNVTFNSGSTYDVEINGTTAGTDHDQLNVTGSVTLGDATLNLSGSYTPSPGDTFIIVNNDSTDGVTGNFTMGTGGTDSNSGTLAQGDTITNFLGTALNATIDYAGGSDGNDVVLTVAATVSVAVSPSDVLENGGTNLEFTFTRSVVTPGTLTVNFTVGGTAVYGTDYSQTGAASFTTTTGTVTFTGSNTTATVTIVPTADTDYEFDETVVLTVAAGPYNVASGPDDTATGAITNDDDTIIVTKTADSNGTCLPNNCSLREAINLANANPDFNNIFFNVSGAGCVSGVCTIQPGGAGSALPGTPLPAITTEVVLDGYSQPGTSANTLADGNDAILGIEIDGSAAGTAADGLVLGTGGDFSTITGLVINRFDGNGIKVISSVNEIIGNFIGTNAAGTAAAANRVGIYLDNSANNLIGCTVPDERNLISGNTDEGIGIYGVSPFNATGNFVQGNFIGTDKTGLLDVGNGGAGVKIYAGSNNFIGVDTLSMLASGGNVISGNGGNGVEISDGVGTATNNNVYGNFIGTDRAGTADISNTGNGVAIYNASMNLIGSATQSVLRNVITNNDKAGVLIEEVTPGTPAASNAVRGNSIYNNGELGIDLTTTAALPGTGDGITANDGGDGDGGANTQQNFPIIRTALVGATNQIRGTLNSTPGQTFTIDLFVNSTCDGSGNGEGQAYLGSTTTTTGANGDGLWSFNPPTLTAGEFVTATATDSVGNTSEFSACFEARAFAAGAVQFVSAPYTDSETNADHLKTITVSRTGGSDGALNVTYTTSDGSATTANNDYVFATGTLHWNNGEAGNKTFDITVKGDTTYEADETVNITLSNVTTGATISGTNPTTLTIANDDAIPLALVVTKTADTNDGFCTVTDCSLREAISNANVNADANTIGFNIPTIDPNRNVTTGVFTISPGSALPGITQPVTIDGYTQTPCSGPNAPPCSQENTLAVGSDAVLLIEINGANSGGYALIIDATNTVLKGLVINRSTQSEIWVNTGTNVSVRGNFIGTDAAGTGDLGNTARSGIEINATNGNTIGGPNPADRNVISGGNGAGVYIINSASNNTVRNNYIGTDKSGMLELQNSSQGVLIENRTNNIIRGNVISGNDADGVEIRGGGSTTPNQILGNIIGLKANGTEAMGNIGSGVILRSGATNHIIGGTLPGEGNIIAFNGGDGVRLDSGVGTSIRGNSIFSNGTFANGHLHLGIDLDPDGVTPNDDDDPDTGVNDLQNFPIIRTALVGTPNQIRGTLNSIPGQTFTIDLYANAACDASGNGEGKTYLGSTTANTGTNGDALWSFNPGTLAPGDVITATATDSAGSTSEFSTCFTATATAFGEIKFAQANTDDTETNSGTHTVNIVVQRVNGANRAVGVTYNITDGGATTGDNDYSVTLASGTLNWANGDSSDKNIPITVHGDTKFELNETVNIALSSPTGGATISGPTSATLTIQNDDTPPTISINDVAQNEGNGPGTTNTSFTVYLSNASYLPITVNYATALGTTDPATFGTCGTAGVDYQAVSGTVSFAPGETSNNTTVLVPVCGETTFEVNETFFVDLSNVNANATILDSRGLGTITNDDAQPTISIDNVTHNEGNLDINSDPVLTSYVFTVTLSNPSYQTITVDYATANDTAAAPADYDAIATTTLTFNPGETSKTVTVTVRGDIIYELDETFFLNLTIPTNATILDSQGLGTITNEDAAPTLSIGNQSRPEQTSTTLSNTTSYQFTVTKSGPTAVTATVNFATAPGTATGNANPCPSGDDYQNKNGSLSFLANETTKTITVLVCKDAVFEADETFFVDLSGEVHATLADAQGLGTIQNDDTPPPLTPVNTTDDVVDVNGCDSTHCSLREAIIAANASPSASIVFGIPAGDPRHFYYKDDGVANQVTLANVTTTTTSDDTTLVGAVVDPIDPDWPHSWWSIQPITPLPTISTTGVGIFVDGHTQTGASPNTSAPGDDAVLRVEIDGSLIVAGVTHGLSLGNGSDTITGLIINRFVGDGNPGTGNGIGISGSDTVRGNFIGADASGTLDLGNAGSGIASTGFSLNIGGSADADVNLISGNNADGITLSNSNTNLILGNLIGTKANGATGLGNGGAGINLTGGGSVFNTIGGENVGEANTIAFNGGDGVSLATAGIGNSIRGNSIFSNGTTSLHLGIDLGTDGLTANDAPVSLDADTGPNNLQNFPVITLAQVTGSTRTITGTLNSTAGASFTIDFYQSTACDNSGNGEGRTYLGSLNTDPTDASGNVSFTFHPSVLTIGQSVTATATSTGASFNTSEFSACNTVTDGSPGAGDIQFTDATYTVGEGGGTASITVKRVGGSNGSITATFSTSNGTAVAPGDYTAVSNFPITFVEGETGNKTVTVTIINDPTFETNETVNLSLSHPSVINIARRDDDAAPLLPPADPYSAVLTINDNDAAPTFTIDDVSHLEGNSSTTSYTFTVTKTGSTALNATVNYVTVDGTATAPSDFTAIGSTMLTFLPAEMTKQVTVLVNGDTTVEPNEAFSVHLSNAVNATISDADGTGTITNDDTDVTVAVSPASVSEDGSTNLVYTFTRTGVTSSALTVNFSVGGGAVFNTDYTQTGAATFGVSSGTVTFGAGNSTTTVTLDPSSDTTVEGDETATLTLTTGSSYNVASPSAATGTITNDDTDVTVAVSPSTATEDGATNLVYTFTRTGVISSALTVNFSVGGSATFGTDYTQSGAATFLAASGTVAFGAGNSTATVTVDPSTDATFESNETIILTVTPGTSYNVAAPSVATGTITNDDSAPTFAIDDVTQNEGNAGTTSYTFTVTKTGSTALNATVDYATVAGTATAPSDFTAIGATTLTFLPADTTKQFTVLVNGDTAVESNEAFTVHLSNPSNATISDADGAGTITNDDTDVTVTVSPASVSEDGASNLVFTFTRAGVTSNALTVNFSVGGDATFATDYTQTGAATFGASSGTVTFGAGNATATVTLDPSVDTTVEGNETSILTVTTGTGYNVASPSAATGTITNDDTDVTVAVSPASVSEDGATNLVYTFTRTGVTSSAQTVNFSVGGDATFATDYTQTGAATFGASSGTVTFGAGNATATVTVDPSSDLTFESNETVILTATSGTGYNVATPSAATGTINNDDAGGGIIRFSAANYNTTESSGSTTITVERVGDTTQVVTVDYATPDDSAATTVVPCATISGLASPRCDFTTALGTLRFAAGETSKTFTVLISQDNYVEGAETLALTLSNLTGGAVFGTPSTALLTIADDATEPATSPIDDPANFVRQHYHDFLNREPDPSGLAFWTNQITSCGGGVQCIEEKRISVSASFFLSIEFQDTGYLVERLYKVSYGDATGTSNFGPPHTLPVPIVKFSEFMPDTQKISQGVIVLQPGWETVLENNKQVFVAEFVQRSRFATAYPTTLTPPAFVDSLFANAGVTPSTTDRNAAINEFGAAVNTADLAARGRALRRMAENSTLKTNEINRAFVLMQYFGYLRRNPNAAQDTDHTGYDFWLTKLNQFNGNFIDAEMVKAFLSSIEYRRRFAP